MFNRSAILLVVANALPLFGVLFLDWNVFLLLLLFWCENVIIGLFGIARMIVAGNTDSPMGGLALPLFFLVHYGGFMFGHLMVLLALFAESGGEVGDLADPAALLAALSAGYLWVPFAALFISHGWSFVENFMGNREHDRLTPGQAMALPYRRMMITHVALLVGGFFVVETGQPLAGLVLLVLLKIGMDLTFHQREHRRLAD
jgi:hypothetical protein